MFTSIFFSPAGSTKKIVDMISGHFSQPHSSIDLTLEDNLSIKDFSPNDTFLFAVPVYGGRIPVLARERISRIKGDGQKAIAIVVYGNRDYDDSLVELCDIVKTQGFKIIAAGAFIAQHCIFPKVATNRPDSKDEVYISEFCSEIKSVINNGYELSLDRIKGKRPYKKLSGVPIHPSADKKLCTLCGICATQCLTGAIPVENPTYTDNRKCIACCRCISVCPHNARTFKGLLYKVAGWKFVKDNTRRLKPQWWV